MQEPSGWCLRDVQGGLAPPLGPTQDHHRWGRPPRQYDPGTKFPLLPLHPHSLITSGIWNL